MTKNQTVMNKTLIRPNINDVFTVITEYVDGFENFIKDNYPSISLSTKSNISEDSLSISVSLVNNDIENVKSICSERILNVFAIQDIQTANICIIIVNGENNGNNIVFKTISKNPSASIKRYIPNILKSTVKMMYTN